MPQQARFNLIKNDFKQLEKRILPRFPYCYMTFRPRLAEGPRDKVYEVREISYSGMQLCLKNGTSLFSLHSELEGEIHWKGQVLRIGGVVKWSKGQRLGIQFDIKRYQAELLRFLSIDNLLKGVQAMHFHPMAELPTGLKYWLCGDGPVEIFIWASHDGEIQSFQAIIMENFIEWQAGVGAKTGKVVTLRDLDTPLLTEDEFIFQWDNGPDRQKLELAHYLVKKIPDHFWSSDIQELLLYKLR